MRKQPPKLSNKEFHKRLKQTPTNSTTAAQKDKARLERLGIVTPPIDSYKFKLEIPELRKTLFFDDKKKYLKAKRKYESKQTA